MGRALGGWSWDGGRGLSGRGTDSWTSCGWTLGPHLCPLCFRASEELKERQKVERAAECCREILHHVNQAVRDMEDLLVRRPAVTPAGAHSQPWGGDRRVAVWPPRRPLMLPSLHQRLKDYQRRLDLSHLRQSSDPMLSEFKVAHLLALPLPGGVPVTSPVPASPAAKGTNHHFLPRTWISPRRSSSTRAH